MESHPSYARAVDRAGKASLDSAPAAARRIVIAKAPVVCAPVAAPRLINLERRAKFAGVKLGRPKATLGMRPQTAPSEIQI